MVKIESFIKDLQILTQDFEVDDQRNFKTILNYRIIIENLSDNIASWYLLTIFLK